MVRCHLSANLGVGKSTHRCRDQREASEAAIDGFGEHRSVIEESLIRKGGSVASESKVRVWGWPAAAREAWHGMHAHLETSVVCPLNINFETDFNSREAERADHRACVNMAVWPEHPELSKSVNHVNHVIDSVIDVIDNVATNVLDGVNNVVHDTVGVVPKVLGVGAVLAEVVPGALLRHSAALVTAAIKSPAVVAVVSIRTVSAGVHVPAVEALAVDRFCASVGMRRLGLVAAGAWVRGNRASSARVALILVAAVVPSPAVVAMVRVGAVSKPARLPAVVANAGLRDGAGGRVQPRVRTVGVALRVPASVGVGHLVVDR